MNSSEYGRITDELLSAYIDNAVTEQERNLVETAVAADAEVAWRLDTLHRTVQMLRALPELALPRSFVIQESQLRDFSTGASQAGGDPAGSVPGRIASVWRAFWHPGSAVYRNLAAASLVLFLIVVAGNTLIDSSVTGTFAPSAELAYSEQPAAVASGEMVAPAESAADVQTERMEGAAPAAKLAGTAEAPDVLEEQAAQEAPAGEEESLAAVPAAEPPPEAAAAALSAEEPAAAEAAEETPGESVALSAEPEAAEVLALEAPAPAESEALILSAPARALAEPAPESAAAEPLRAEGADAAESPATLDFSAAAEPAPAEAEIRDRSQEPEEPLESVGEAVTAGDIAVEEITAEQTPEEVVAMLPPLATDTPLPTATAQVLTAAESPQTLPYPGPAQGPRFGIADLTLSRILTFSLFVAAIVFAGLWWRSRSGPGASSRT